MADNEASTSHEPAHEPDFELSRRGIIREDNWQEYAAKGFIPVPEDFGIAQIFYGVPNVYTGDGYDYAEGRPLRNMPDSGVYTNQAGLKHLKAQQDKGWAPMSFPD